MKKCRFVVGWQGLAPGGVSWRAMSVEVCFLNGVQEVAGSNPVGPTMHTRTYVARRESLLRCRGAYRSKRTMLQRCLTQNGLLTSATAFYIPCARGVSPSRHPRKRDPSQCENGCKPRSDS